MRWIGLVVVIAAACGGMDERPALDGGVDVEPPLAQGTHNLGVRIGGACEDDQGLVCGDGVLGACLESVCRAQCSAVGFPRCAAGFVEHHAMTGGADMCVCVPE